MDHVDRGLHVLQPPEQRLVLAVDLLAHLFAVGVMQPPAGGRWRGDLRELRPARLRRLLSSEDLAQLIEQDGVLVPARPRGTPQRTEERDGDVVR